jgi:hypothetical protein
MPAFPAISGLQSGGRYFHFQFILTRKPSDLDFSVFLTIGATRHISTMPPSLSASQVDPTLVSKLLSDVDELVKAATSGNARAREAAVSSCLALASALETPSEAIVRMTWTEVSQALYRSLVILRSYVSLLTSVFLRVSQQKVALRRLALSLGEHAQQTLA